MLIKNISILIFDNISLFCIEKVPYATFLFRNSLYSSKIRIFLLLIEIQWCTIYTNKSLFDKMLLQKSCIVPNIILIE